MSLDLQQKINDALDNAATAQRQAARMIDRKEIAGAQVIISLGRFALELAQTLIVLENMRTLHAIRLHLNTIAINTWGPGDPQPRGLFEEEKDQA